MGWARTVTLTILQVPRLPCQFFFFSSELCGPVRTMHCFNFPLSLAFFFFFPLKKERNKEKKIKKRK